MSETENNSRAVLPEAVVLSRLQKSDEMREFFIEMWKQNPALANQGGARVRELLSCVATKQRGISLIELIMFIVIVSIGVTGILLVMNQVTVHSADPLIHKQALAVAESILEEVELMPLTYCDPDDASAVTATSTADCASVEVAGVENDVSRYDATFPFDNVSDYHGFGMASGSILDISGANTGLSGYTLKPITVTAIDFGAITAASGDALLITVAVTDPTGTDIVLEGIRTRYSPNSVP